MNTLYKIVLSFAFYHRNKNNTGWILLFIPINLLIGVTIFLFFIKDLHPRSLILIIFIVFSVNFTLFCFYVANMKSISIHFDHLILNIPILLRKKIYFNEIISLNELKLKNYTYYLISTDKFSFVVRKYESIDTSKFTQKEIHLSVLPPIVTPIILLSIILTSFDSLFSFNALNNFEKYFGLSFIVFIGLCLLFNKQRIFTINTEKKV